MFKRLSDSMSLADAQLKAPASAIILQFEWGGYGFIEILSDEMPHLLVLGLNDVSPLTCVRYRLDGGAWIELGVPIK